MSELQSREQMLRGLKPDAKKEACAEAYRAGAEAMRARIIAKIREMAPEKPPHTITHFDREYDIEWSEKVGRTIKLLKPEAIVAAIAALPLEEMP